MGEKIYFEVGMFKLRVPAHIAPLCTHHEYDRRHHGIDWDEGYTCQGSGLVTEFGNRPFNSQCENCTKIWPIRCIGKGCEVLIEPTPSGGNWYNPYPYCQDCESGRLTEMAVGLLDEIPQDTLSNAVNGWRNAKHRADAEKECKFWLAGDLGKHNGGLTGLYFYGDVGSGKTTLAARCAVKAIRSGKVHSFMWVKEYDLMMASRAMGYEAKGAASELFMRVQSVDLLVLDEMFAVSESLTEQAKTIVGQALAKRFESKRPTIITSNHEPSWAALYDVRVNSRYNGMFTTVKLNGPDLRQHFRGRGL